MKVLVAHDSRTGRTREVAERIGLVVQGSTPRVSVASVADLLPEDVLAADVLFLGAWVDGFIVVGVGPSGRAMAWARALPSLEGRLAAVFCTYGVNPRRTLQEMSKVLTSKGAIVLGGHASRRNNVLRGVEPFTREVMAEVRSRLKTPPPSRPALR
jgi:Flavodoxin domain